VSILNISNFLWNIADDVLRDVSVRGKYRNVILPMTVAQSIAVNDTDCYSRRAVDDTYSAQGRAVGDT
jgi:type I restriction-modification system DNA methylase subunit